MQDAGYDVTVQYVREESDDLVLRVLADVESDGFAKDGVDAEMVALSVLSHAMIKCLAIRCERHSHPDLALAYMQMMTLHTEIVKDHVIRLEGTGYERRGR